MTTRRAQRPRWASRAWWAVSASISAALIWPRSTGSTAAPRSRTVAAAPAVAWTASSRAWLTAGTVDCRAWAAAALADREADRAASLACSAALVAAWAADGGTLARACSHSGTTRGMTALSMWGASRCHASSV